MSDIFDNPRTSQDNAVTIASWHRRYSLGDVQPNESPDAYMTDNKINKKTCVILPVYMYDHGGITISTSHTYPYNDMWDAGQVGFIYISKKNAVKEWGKKIFTKAVEKKAIACLASEVKTYDDFLTGNVYGGE